MLQAKVNHPLESPMTTLCDLYLRLSDGRNENGSFADREAALRGKAAALDWTVYRVVIENDLMNGSKSASAFKRRKVGTDPSGKPIMRVWRPGFRSILDDLAAGRVQAVLAEDLDRTMRDPRDAEDLIDIVRERAAHADSLSGSLRFSAGGTDAELLQARILVSVAQKASQDTSRRVTAARERQAANGRYGGGRRPYGFNADGLTVCESEAAVIRACADQVLSKTFGTAGGNSLKSIARALREREVPTVTGTRWTAESLRDVLIKPRNAGIIVYQGEETAVRLPGEPILPEDVWRAVVAKLTDPSRSTPGRAPTWLLTNIARCVCGSKMEIQVGRGRAASYRCAREGGAGDVHVRRNAAHLDAFVTAAVAERMSKQDAVDVVVKPAATVDVKALRRQALALRELLDEYARDRADGLISREQMLAGTRRTRDNLARVEAALAAVTDTSPLAALVGADDVAAKFESLPLGQRRAIVVELMTVTVLPTTRKGSGFDTNAVKLDPANR